MKYLKRGSRGSDVRELQRFLKNKGYWIILDSFGNESYGPNMEEVVRSYQTNEALTVDGKWGPQCIASMSRASLCLYQEAKYDRQTEIIRMRKGYTKAMVVNPKGATVKDMMKSVKNQGYTLVINGTLYDMPTLTDLAGLKKDYANCGGPYYSKYGLNTTSNRRVGIGKNENFNRDFAGFSPALIVKNEDIYDFTNLTVAFVNNRAPRTGVLVTDDYITVVLVKGRSWWRGWKGLNVWDFSKLCSTLAKFENTKTYSSGMFDGGYSTGACNNKGKLFGHANKYRKVANGIAFAVEGVR